MTGTGATLSWTASTAGTYPIAGYDVYSSAGRLVAQVGAGTTSYAVTGLNTKRTSPYGYYVEAVDTQGTASAASDIAQFITASFTSQSANAATAPGTPGTPVATSVGTGGATLTWGAATAGSNAVSDYDVYELIPAAHLVASVGASTTSYALTGLSPSTAYGYEVAALDGTGRISTVTAAAAFTTPGTGSTGSASPTATATATATSTATATATSTATATATSSPTTSPSSSTSSSPSTSPTGAPGTCTAAYAITGSWSAGFQASVTVTAGSTAIGGWTVTWTLPSGQAITNLWNGTESASGQNVTVADAAYDGALSAGGATSFGFTASDAGTAAAPASVACTPTG